ncbi:hypothetical protein [Scytonema sp. HK-05]|nr:hypothetical protein [Scytonema sp. HK-05]
MYRIVGMFLTMAVKVFVVHWTHKKFVMSVRSLCYADARTGLAATKS